MNIVRGMVVWSMLTGIVRDEQLRTSPEMLLITEEDDAPRPGPVREPRKMPSAEIDKTIGYYYRQEQNGGCPAFRRY
jgi:hypothetical protein